MSSVTHPWTVLVLVAMLAGILSEGYRSEYYRVAKFPHWTKELYLYTAANFYGTNAMTAVEELVFYDYPIAFNPAKARLALEEKGLKYTEKRIDIMNGQALEPWYMRLNRHGWSPTLVTGKEVLTESMDIIKWADRQGPALGGDTVNKTYVSEWLSKVDAWDGNLFAMANSSAGGLVKYITKWKIKVGQAHATRNADLSDIYLKKIASMRGILRDVDDAATVEANKKQLAALLDEAEVRLAHSKFLAGDQYSMADTIFTPVVYRLYAVKKDQEYLNSRTRVRQYYQLLKQRPSYSKVFGFSDSGFAACFDQSVFLQSHWQVLVGGKFNLFAGFREMQHNISEECDNAALVTIVALSEVSYSCIFALSEVSYCCIFELSSERLKTIH